VDTPPPAPPAPPSSPAPPPTSQSYEEEIAAYENAITQALSSNDASKLPDIRARADRVIASLNKRIEDMTYLKKDTPDIRIERDRLLEVLRRIQNDYNGLRENTDDLETLRRIREQEGGAAKAEVMWYLIAFLIAVVALIGVIFMMGGQKALATAINPSTPAMSPPLM
jgi:Flp pilus assembly pilin Flp